MRGKRSHASLGVGEHCISDIALVSELVLFDLDNTLLSGDSDFEWAQFLIAQGVLDREVYAARNQAFYDAYRAGTLDIHEFLDFQLRPLARHPRTVLEAWHARFMHERVQPMISARARACVAEWQAKGALCAIVTATNDFVTAPIARAFGIEHLIATRAQLLNGEYTGRVEGVPCFRHGKIERVEAWLAARDLDWRDFDRSYFYSDSQNDLPLLQRVTHPVAVDPDPILRATAQERRWPIISLRD